MIAARLSRTDKLTLAKNIVTHAQLLLAEFGKPEKIHCPSQNRYIQVSVAKIGDLNIMINTPFSGVKTGHGDFRYQVDMWHSKIGKVFGACWDPQKRWANEFECFRLVKGEWIDSFLACEKS